MKHVTLAYNPYRLRTDITVDGQPLKANSSLHFGHRRLQEWAGDLFPLISKEYRDMNICLEFTGSQEDYEDLCTVVKTQVHDIVVEFGPFHREPSILDRGMAIYQIYNDIWHGSIDVFRDDEKIQAAFLDVRKPELEIKVLAPKSSKKSVLINALLGTQLFSPGHTEQTTPLVRVKDERLPHFQGDAFDAAGGRVAHECEFTAQVMQTWSSDVNISDIVISGPLSGILAEKVSLQLVDMPRINSAHRLMYSDITSRILDNFDQSVVLCMLSGQQQDEHEENEFLDDVCQMMQSKGQQSLDRVMFVVDVEERFDSERKYIEDALRMIKNRIEARGIHEPHIFALSSMAALEYRTDIQNKRILPVFQSYAAHNSSFHLSQYYEYNHLPSRIRESINHQLATLPENEQVEIHTGITAIEEAILMYVNKYVRTVKVCDLVQTIHERLKAHEVLSGIQGTIDQKQEELQELQKEIETTTQGLQDPALDEKLCAIVDQQDISQYYTAIEEAEIEARLNSEFDCILAEYKSSNGLIRKTTLKSVVETLETRMDDVGHYFADRVDDGIAKAVEVIEQEISGYMRKLDIAFPFEINVRRSHMPPYDINLDEWIPQTTQIVSQKRIQEKTVPIYYPVPSDDTLVDLLKALFGQKTSVPNVQMKQRVRYKTVKEEVIEKVERINLPSFLQKYSQSVQDAILLLQQRAVRRAIRVLDNSKEEIKEKLVSEFRGLAEEALEQFIQQQQVLIREIQSQQNALERTQTFINRVNQLIQ